MDQVACSEAEGKKLGAAGGVAVNQGTQADLVRNACAGDRLGDGADDDAEHGGATVEALSPLELIQVDLLGSTILEPFVVCCGFGHDESGFGREIARAGQEVGDHAGEHQNESYKAGNGCCVIGLHSGSAEADLGEDSLAGQELGAKADQETEHGETAIPGFGKGDKPEALGVIHGFVAWCYGDCNGM